MVRLLSQFPSTIQRRTRSCANVWRLAGKIGTNDSGLRASPTALPLPIQSTVFARAEARGQALFGPLAANFFALNLKILASIHFMQLGRVAFGIREPVPQARFHLLARRQ